MLDTILVDGSFTPGNFAKNYNNQDVKFVKDAGADGFILGSSLFNDYDNLEALSETISGFKKASE